MQMLMILGNFYAVCIRLIWNCFIVALTVVTSPRIALFTASRRVLTGARIVTALIPGFIDFGSVTNLRMPVQTFRLMS